MSTCRGAINNEDDNYHHELEQVPAGAQERFLESLMSLRRSDHLSLNFSPDSTSGSMPFNSCHDEEAAASSMRRSSMCSVVSAAAAAGTLKSHVCSRGTQAQHCVRECARYRLHAQPQSFRLNKIFDLFASFLSALD